jgi:hypothetical protein
VPLGSARSNARSTPFVEFQFAATTTTHWRERRKGFAAARASAAGTMSAARNNENQSGRIAMN